MFERQEKQVIMQRLAESRRFIQVLIGPRQVGKSTIMKQVMDSISIPHLFFSSDAEAVSSGMWISSSWANARRQMQQQQASEFLLVFDEIQKVANWSEYVKREWDADTMNNVNIKVVLLGSSRILLEKGLSESMMGRYEIIKLGHWSYKEMREAFGFSLEEYLFYGGFPGAAPLIHSEPERWEEYISNSIIDATIHKDIILNSPINKPALLRQTFELGTTYSGELLSYTKVVGMLQDAGNTTTVASYTELLGQANLLCTLPKYAVDVARQRASVPKWQVFDNALKNVYLQLPLSIVLSNHQLWGRVVESAVGAYIVNQAFKYRIKVYYWRDGDKEVDFVLQRGERVIGIEVKSNKDDYTKGMEVFQNKYHPNDIFIVGDGGFPLAEFLDTDLRTLF